MDRATTPLIKESEILTEGRAQYVILHLPNSDKLTIINMYAARASRDRTPMWKRISEANFQSNHTILGGDFNHLEEIESRRMAGERRMHKREAASWHHLTLQYGLADVWALDSFRKMSKKNYTFNNGRSGPGSVVSRIDKFLVSQDLDSRGGRIEAPPSIRKMFDHSPLVMTIWGLTTAPLITNPYFDTSLLRDEDSRTALLKAWEGTNLPPNCNREWPA